MSKLNRKLLKIVIIKEAVIAKGTNLTTNYVRKSQSK